MARRRLATTRSAELRPLGTPGQRSYDLVRREAEALGPRHAALFAEPFPSPEGDITDWYAAVPGPARLLSEAPAEERQAGQALLESLTADLVDRAEQLSAARDPETRRLGAALRAALEVPGEGEIHLVGDQPVLVGWAHHLNLAEPPRNLLVGRLEEAPAPRAPAMVPSAAPPEVAPDALPAAAAVPPPPPATAPAAPAAAPRGFGWLWWLLWAAIGALALVIAWILLPACGIAGLGWADTCTRPAARMAPAELARGAELEAELHRLERRIGEAGAACRPVPDQRAEGPVCGPGDRAAIAEAMFLIDASTSMRRGISTPAGIEAELGRIWARGAAGTLSAEDRRRRDELDREARDDAHGTDRIDVAKAAVVDALGRMAPGRVRIGSFNACGAARISDPFSDPAAAAGTVEGIRLSGETALAEGITSAAAAFDGGLTAGDPVNMVLVTDGRDTCGGDPCAAARAARAARPGLAIHVVALVDLPELRCIAEETGGRYTTLSALGGGAEDLPGLLGRDATAGGVCVPSTEAAPETAPEADRADTTFDERVARESGASSDRLGMTLVWDTVNDLDLRVTCPGGGEINWEHPAACGGRLDIDQNASAPSSPPPTSSPVENIVFEEPRPGRYVVEVHNFKQATGTPSRYRLRIRKNGTDQIEEGRFTETGERRQYVITYP